MLRNAASLSNYPTSTWAALPAAASSAGLIVRVTDFGLAGVGLLVISDGTRWLPLGPQVLARSGVAATVTGTTAETVLATVAVPAGLLGVNGGLELRSTWTYTNSANNKTLRARFSGAAGTAFLNAVATATASSYDVTKVMNRGATGSQVGFSQNANGSGSNLITQPTASAVDTTPQTSVSISGQLALGTETITLEAFEVWVLP